MSQHQQTGDRFADVASLLAPSSVVVVGASDRAENLGGAAVRHLRKFGFPGQVLPVNPKSETVAGLPCYPSLADLPPVVRPALAILAVPAPATIGLVRECVDAGIDYGVIWSGGFAELDAAGAELQDELVAACRETGFIVVGPNCLGAIDTHLPLTATFSSFLLQRDHLQPGNISMASQSGGLATMIQALADEAGFGFRYMISGGNEAVVTTPDYVHALVHDDETKVISLYVEGVRDGDKLVEALDEAKAVGKPVVVLKAGLSGATARAAAAHTGALVGEDRVWRAVFRDHGAIQVETLEELLDVVVFLSSTDLSKLPSGNGVATVTFGGGMGVLSVDGCAHNGLATPAFTDDTRRRLRDLVPPIAAIANPVDLTPAAYYEPWISRLPDALEVMAEDPGVHTILAQFGTTPLDGFRMAQAVADLRDRTTKTVAIAWPFAPARVPELLRDQGMAMFKAYARATAVIGKIVAATAAGDRPDRGAAIPRAVPWGEFVPDPKAGTVVSEHDCHQLLAAAGLPTAAGRLATSEQEAVASAAGVTWPVAIKGISPSVTHRAAAGLVVLGLRTPGEVRSAYRRVTQRATDQGHALEGVYVQHMMADGLDFLVSALRDPVFGVVVTVGAGGVLTEVIDDVAIARAPFSASYARYLLGRLRLVQRLGTQGDALSEFVAHFSQIAADTPWERFVLEVNPIRVTSRHAGAVDGLLIIEQP